MVCLPDGVSQLISGAGKAVGEHIPPTALFFCGGSSPLGYLRWLGNIGSMLVSKLPPSMREPI
jgi:hypothetical protein